MTTPLAERIAAGLVKYLFLPANIPSRALGRVALIVVLTASVGTVVLSFPPLVDVVWQDAFSPGTKALIIKHRDAIKCWVGHLTLLVEVVVALAIGGTVFGVYLTQKAKESIVRYQQARGWMLDNWKTGLRGNIQMTVKEMLTLIGGTKFSNLVGNTYRLSRLAWRLQRQVFTAYPAFYRRHIICMFYSNFPGGLYGLIAFVFFLALLGLKVTQVYLDSPSLA